jgi:hypothetical protein
MYIASDISHNVAESQPKIILFMGLKKKTKFDMFRRFENVLFRSTLLLFLCSSKYKYLELNFCTFVRYIINYIRILSQTFSELKNIFSIFFETESTGAHVHQISIPFQFTTLQIVNLPLTNN